MLYDIYAKYKCILMTVIKTALKKNYYFSTFIILFLKNYLKESREISNCYYSSRRNRFVYMSLDTWKLFKSIIICGELRLCKL